MPAGEIGAGGGGTRAGRQEEKVGKKRGGEGKVGSRGPVDGEGDRQAPLEKGRLPHIVKTPALFIQSNIHSFHNSVLDE